MGLFYQVGRGACKQQGRGADGQPPRTAHHDQHRNSNPECFKLGSAAANFGHTSCHLHPASCILRPAPCAEKRGSHPGILGGKNLAASSPQDYRNLSLHPLLKFPTGRHPRHPMAWDHLGPSTWGWPFFWNRLGCFDCLGHHDRAWKAGEGHFSHNVYSISDGQGLETPEHPVLQSPDMMTNGSANKGRFQATRLDTVQ